MLVEGRAESTPVGPPSRLRLNGGWLAAALFLLLAATRGYYLADTTTYVAQIVPYLGHSPAGPGRGLWEFGHLLWRPLGWAFLEAANPMLGRLTGWEPPLVCAFGLIAASMVCGFVTVLLWYSMVCRISGSPAVAFLVAFGMACSNAMLTYMHAGTSYVPGLCAVTLSVWVLLRRPGPGGLVGPLAAAALAALAALLWFPYALSMPGLIAVGIWGASNRARFLTRFSLFLAVFLLLGVGLCAWAGGIRSIPQARAWIADSGHGWVQTDRLMRMATGLPRGFLFMGNDGVTYRRFLRKDPQAPVTLTELIRASLWKILAVYLFLACLLYELVRARRDLWSLAILLAGACPVLLFAVAVFEPGSAERYLPAYPFLVLVLAAALRDFPRSRRASQVALAGFLLAMVATNVWYMNRLRLDREDAAAIARVAPLRARMKPGSLVTILSNQDELEPILNRAPFDSINRPEPFHLYDAIEPATARVAFWRSQFVSEALAAWARGGEVWVSKRLRASVPLPEWKWVEGDDKRISWREIAAFFMPLQMDAEAGGPDGFVRLAPSDLKAAPLTTSP